MKQIQFGKNTLGYDNYLASVAKEKRKHPSVHPRTPDIYEDISKRNFDGLVKSWRRALHKWDNSEVRPDLLPRPPRDNTDGKDGNSEANGSKKRKSGDVEDFSKQVSPNSANKKGKTTHSIPSSELNKPATEEQDKEGEGDGRTRLLIGEESEDGYHSDKQVEEEEEDVL